MTKRIVFGAVPALTLLASQGDLSAVRRQYGDQSQGRQSRESHDAIGLRDIVGADMVGLRNIIGGKAVRALISAGVLRTTSVQSGEVVEREPLDLKRKILPIPLIEVDTGDTVRVSIKPQELFKAKRLVIAPDIADDFRIGNAKVATRDQFSGPGFVPASIFGPTAFDVNIDWDSCDVGEEISFDITNFGGGEAPLTFGGAFLGTSVY